MEWMEWMDGNIIEKRKTKKTGEKKSETEFKGGISGDGRIGVGEYDKD